MTNEEAETKLDEAASLIHEVFRAVRDGKLVIDFDNGNQEDLHMSIWSVQDTIKRLGGVI